MSWLDIYGQTKAIDLLKTDLLADRIAESYLFTGPEGTGKRKTALEFAKSLNCEKFIGKPEPSEPEPDEPSLFGADPAPEPVPAPQGKSADPCDVCVSCKKITDGIHPEIFTLDFDSQARLLELDEEKNLTQKEYRIESVRALVSRARLTSPGGSHKVFIIDGAELLNASAANAMLKSLEESPKFCHWILLTASIERVLPTVRSRCRKVPFAPLTADAIETILSRRPDLTGQQIDGDELKKICASCDGSIGTALFLTGEVSESCRETAAAIVRLSSGTSKKSARELLQDSAKVLSEGKRAGMKKTAEQFLRVLSLEAAHELRQNPQVRTAEMLARVIQSQEDLRRNVSPQMIIDSLFMDSAR